MDESGEPRSAKADSQVGRDIGTLRFSEVTFRAYTDQGFPLSFSPGAVTVFIGPNNGGKSRALKEIAGELSGASSPSQQKVIIESAVLVTLTDLQIDNRFEDIADTGYITDQFGRKTVVVARRGASEEVAVDVIKANYLRPSNDYEYRQGRSKFLSNFLLELSGQGRLDLLQNGQAQNLKDKPKSLAASFAKDKALIAKLSSACFDAFGFHLAIDATSMSTLAFSLSSEPVPEHVNRSFSDEAIDFFQSGISIPDVSDGTRAYLGILAEVLAGSADIIVIDEPEAFLHPSLARQLAKDIAAEIGDNKQLFLATHSSSFLAGLVSSSTNIDVVRLTRRSLESGATVLPAESLRDMMDDPLLRSANLLEGLFFESCVVVEGDGDAAFYREINERLSANGRKHIRHVHFVTSHSKQSSPRFVGPLRKLGIPAAYILDIDWIKEDGVVGLSYLRSAGVPAAILDSMLAQRKSIRRMLEAKNANYKRSGGVALLSGSDREAADEFFDRCEAFGIFTVRAGELESWLSYVPANRSKSRWIASIFEAMGSDPQNSDYVRPQQGDVWRFIERISEWLDDRQRKGMT